MSGRPLLLRLPPALHERLLDAAAAAGTCAAEHGVALLARALTGLSAPPLPEPSAAPVTAAAPEPDKPTARQKREIRAHAAAGHDAKAIARRTKIKIAIVRQVLA